MNWCGWRTRMESSFLNNRMRRPSKNKRQLVRLMEIQTRKNQAVTMVKAMRTRKTSSSWLNTSTCYSLLLRSSQRVITSAPLNLSSKKSSCRTCHLSCRFQMRSLKPEGGSIDSLRVQVCLSAVWRVSKMKVLIVYSWIKRPTTFRKKWEIKLAWLPTFASIWCPWRSWAISSAWFRPLEI